MLTRGEIEKMAAQIGSALKPDQIILFGSYAWGTPGADSDVDLCVVYTELKEHPRVLALRARQAVADIKHPKDILVKSRSQLEKYRHLKAPLASKILNYGQVLYG